ncbi:hypothetical protein LTS18_010048, partial [Coniosporium uncinatum]
AMLASYCSTKRSRLCWQRCRKGRNLWCFGACDTSKAFGRLRLPRSIDRWVHSTMSMSSCFPPCRWIWLSMTRYWETSKRRGRRSWEQKRKTLWYLKTGRRPVMIVTTTC